MHMLPGCCRSYISASGSFISTAHVRSVLDDPSGKDSHGGGVWHTNHSDIDRGLWSVHDTARLGPGAIRLGLCIDQVPHDDRVKLLADRICDPTAEPLLTKKATVAVPRKG
jgi:hypothetical protein